MLAIGNSSGSGAMSRRLPRFVLCRLLFTVAFLLPFILHIPAPVVATADHGAVVEFSKENSLHCDVNGIGNSTHGCRSEIYKEKVRRPTKRIVGGNDASKGRYPYFVSLQAVYNGPHRCGGSLVAPDIVMTAAHCQSDIKYAQVGKYFVATNSEDETYNVETFEVTGPMYPHPLYNSGVSFSHDVLLFKLNRKSNNQYIRLNTDPNIPSPPASTDNNDSDNKGAGNSLSVIGMGATKFGKVEVSIPNVLQETMISYVPNRICRRAKDQFFDENYQNLISDDMLCAFEEGQDACQGDSGSGLIQVGNSPNNDLLVGIVSWGFGCAHPSFPGVYSRVSYFSEWVIATICQHSSEPPPEYDCANVAPPSQESSVPVTVIIQFDDNPGEISWSISHAVSGTVLVNVTEELGIAARSRSQETVFVPIGSLLTFTIRDRYGDGLCCSTPGNFRVVLGRNAIGQVLAFGGGNFGYEDSHSFLVPQNFVDEEEKGLIGDEQILLTVVIQLDSFPEEIGWRIDRLGIQIDDVIRIPAGIYTIPDAKIIRTIVLEKNELYYFNIYDIIEDGIGVGYVQLFLGTRDITDSSRKIYESDGNFQSGTDHTFFASFPSTFSPPPSDEYMYLTLVLKMDLYPGEIGLQLRANEDVATMREDKGDAIIFFRPPNYYKDRVNAIVTERIPIPRSYVDSSRQFSFIITDRSEDGMCCGWNGELDTGYTLYEGDPSFDSLIVDSKFESIGREVHTFRLSGDKISHGDEGTDPTIPVQVTLMLDEYPEETGYFITNALGKRLIYVAPGSFTEQNAVVEKTYDLYAGLFTFNIIDTFGDGINRDSTVYKIDIMGESNRPPVLSGTGSFMKTSSQAFLLEGEQAQYPVQLDFKTGNQSEEFGFSMYRLDRIEAVSSIASKSIGEYKVPFDDISEQLQVTRGGLYKIVFENSFFGVDGMIRITLGSFEPTVYNDIEYTIDTSETENNKLFEMKFFADLPLPPSAGINARRLSLTILSNRFAIGFEWVILSSSRSSSLDAKGETGIIAYGPLDMQTKRNETHVLYHEDIILSQPEGIQNYTMIVTSVDNFEALGGGALLVLNDGQSEDGATIHIDKVEAGRRTVFSFSLEDSGSASSLLGTKSSYVMISAFALLVPIVFNW